MKLNGLEKNFKTVSGKIVDLKQVNKDGYTPLMYAILFNKEKNLNFSTEQFSYLIQNSDLKQVSNLGYTPLLLVLIWNKSEDLNLNDGQFDYLIKNSDLKNVDKYGYSALIVALKFNKSENLNLSKKYWKYLIENSDLSLVKDKEQLIELKKIQSELINDIILNKIGITEEINKKNNKI